MSAESEVLGWASGVRNQACGLRCCRALLLGRKSVWLLLLMLLAGCSGAQTLSRHSSSSIPGGAGPSSPVIPPPGKHVVGKKPPMPEQIDIPTPANYSVRDFVSGLVVPWDMAFLTNSRLLVTERQGRVRLVENGSLRQEPYKTLSNVYARGEGGLMGIALHPGYPNPSYVYLMYTYRADGNIYNRVSRFRDTGSTLVDEAPMVVRIPGALYHNGGIIRFGPDGMLYIGTGDATEHELAQDRSSYAGKILRITRSGGVPDDNPYKSSPVYATGLRNVQGLAWNPANDDLWATMHGPTGEYGLHAKDEVFIVPKGGNAGWPRTLGVTDYSGVLKPVLFFPEAAVPPARAIFYDSSLMPGLRGSFFFTSLRDEALYRVSLHGSRDITRIERWFRQGVHNGRYGRLRALTVGPDGAIYVSTSNRDGRADARPGDDRILRITPK